jgi:hypothetical protein
MSNAIIATGRTALVAGRRALITGAGQATLSATAVALLVGCETMAQGQGGATAGDVAILNVALGLEHEAINAYQLGAETGLLPKNALDIAVLFQTHHKEHRDALVATIRKLGGMPVAEKAKAEYATALNAGAIRTAGDILKLASRLEKGAANAYLGVIPSFQDKALAQVAARLAADETMHWTALSSALGRQLPSAPLSFGA